MVSEAESEVEAAEPKLDEAQLQDKAREFQSAFKAEQDRTAELDRRNSNLLSKVATLNRDYVREHSARVQAEAIISAAIPRVEQLLQTLLELPGVSQSGTGANEIWIEGRALLDLLKAERKGEIENPPAAA